MMRVASIAVLCAVGLANGEDSYRLELQQPAVLAEPRLDVRIGAPSPAQYRAVRDARDWRNPYLDVSNEGYRLKSMSLPGSRFVATADLRRALSDLPVGDWPYGRVVVVQSPSIVPGDEAWIAAMRKNVMTAIELLALDADWWGWPP